jgi:hypothetical protein
VVPPLERLAAEKRPIVRAALQMHRTCLMTHVPLSAQVYQEQGMQKTAAESRTPDQLLTTTPTIRKRLDLTRPVPLVLIEDCLRVALPGAYRPLLAFVSTDIPS